MYLRIKIISLTTLLGLVLSVNAFGQPLQDVRICIDAGHGGYTSDDRQIFLPNGIVYWESEGDLETSFHLRDYLSFKVIYTYYGLFQNLIESKIWKDKVI